MNIVISFFLDSYQKDNDNRNNYKNISWSPYDRIMIRKVSSFEELCTSELSISSEGKDSLWNGVEQKMHLVSESTTASCVKVTDAEDSQAIIIANDRIYNFYCIITLNYVEEINELIGQNGSVKIESEIKNAVASVLSTKGITYVRFRSLGSEDMVIMLLSDSMNTIVSCVNEILSIQYAINENSMERPSEIFSPEACVFTGLNKIKCDAYNDVELVIRLNLKKQNHEQVIEKICKVLSLGHL